MISPHTVVADIPYCVGDAVADIPSCCYCVGVVVADHTVVADIPSC